MSRWFRSYADTHRNPKVARLSDADFRLWHELLCVASDNDGNIPCLDDLKFLINRRLDHLSKALQRLISGGLIDVLGDGYAPRNWGERQYKSDTSTDRVQKYRAKRNVSVTPPDTETDTDTEKATPPNPRKRGNGERSLLPLDWELPPVSALPPKARACAEQWTQDSYETEGEAFVCYWRSERKMKADWNGTWANRVIARHSAIMRDQKFGNAAPKAPAKPLTDEERIEHLRKMIPLYEKMGRSEDVVECERRIEALERPIDPAMSAKVSSIVRSIGRAA